MMSIDVKLYRFDNTPWGFRLVGGSDFEHPLTVVKVREGSLAEQAELKINDIIVRINDEATSPLTHEEVDKLIRSSGNILFLGIKRQPKNVDGKTECKYINLEEQDENSVYEKYTIFEAKDKTINAKYSEELQEEEIIKQVELNMEQIETIVAEREITERHVSVFSEESERKVVEDEIAAVLSNEMEMSKQHSELRNSTDTDVYKGRDVLSPLNEDVIKIKTKMEEENRKWTTFLQKPNRPIPKSKQQIEAERRKANAYKVTIIKTKRPSIMLLDNEQHNEENKEALTEISESEPDIPTPMDSEIPNLDDEIDVTCSNETAQTNLEENPDDEKNNDLEEPNEPVEEMDTQENKSQEEETHKETERVLDENTEEELALEQQLSDVQKQLAALSNLPSTIQVTLDSVTRQLAELIPVLRLQQQANKLHKLTEQTEIRFVNMKKIDEYPTTSLCEDNDNGKDNDNNESNKDSETATMEYDNVTEKAMHEKDDIQRDGDRDEENVLNNKITKQIISDTNEAYNTIEKNSINKQRQYQHLPTVTNEMEMGDTSKHICDHGITKHKLHTRYDVIEELEEHLARIKNPKRAKCKFGPLTPSSERPLILPGGRRWYRPKDAYDDEFIAETLSAQAELIAGTALGVNFMKYQKPERKIDLKRSEVYKVIHHLDRQPVRSIEVRPPVVPAEADIRKAIHS